jgi:P4 family phage/plasmid primase-like protien
MVLELRTQRNPNSLALRLRRPGPPTPARPPDDELPEIPPVGAEEIPEEMMPYPHWANWRYAWRWKKKEGAWRPDKVPVNPRTGLPAKSNDPGTWGTFDEAMDGHRRSRGRLGVGFFFGRDDPFGGVDYDAPYAEAGGLKPEVEADLLALGTYAEESVSGRGLHAIGRFSVPEGTNNRTLGIEVYSQGRFFVVTGRRLEGSPAEVRGTQAAADVIYRRIKPAEPAPRHADGKARPLWSNGLTDDEVLERARAAKNARKFNLLWDGDLAGKDSDSEADAALLAMIAFWTGPDPVQMVRIFGLSKRAERDKWDREDYRRRTIASVLRRKTKYWTPAGDKVTNPHRLARAYMASKGGDGDGPCLRRWNKAWYAWEGRRYQEQSDEDVQADVGSFLAWEFHRAYRAALVRHEAGGRGKDHPKEHDVTSGRIDNVVLALKGLGEGETGKVMTSGDVALNSWAGDGGWERRSLLAVGNGVLDVDAFVAGRSRVLLPHATRWFSTACLPYNYDPAATCQLWEDVLDRLQEKDGERIAVLQEFFGLCLAYDTDLASMLFLEGEGHNGKSVVCAGLEAMLGKDNVSAAPLEAFDKDQKYALIPTLGKLANIVNDGQQVDRINEGKFKQYVSGDPIQVEGKYRPCFLTRPTARWVVALNNFPYFADKTLGLWRRIIAMPFRVQVTREERVLGMNKPEWWLASGLMPGVLNWALRGLLRLRRQGDFTASSVCDALKRRHQEEGDAALQYLLDHCRHKAGAATPAKALYQWYRGWFRLNGYGKELSLNRFGMTVVRAFPHLKEYQKTDSEGRATRKRNVGEKSVACYLDLECDQDGGLRE